MIVAFFLVLALFLFVSNLSLNLQKGKKAKNTVCWSGIGKKIERWHLHCNGS